MKNNPKHTVEIKKTKRIEKEKVTTLKPKGFMKAGTPANFKYIPSISNRILLRFMNRGRGE